MRSMQSFRVLTEGSVQFVWDNLDLKPDEYGRLLSAIAKESQWAPDSDVKGRPFGPTPVRPSGPTL